jgi:uncharacterized protein involved in exopolysaccharide biosynthesis
MQGRLVLDGKVIMDVPQASGAQLVSIGEPVIGLREVFYFLWGGRWLLLSMIVLCTVAATVLVEVIPSRYEADILLSAVTDQSGRSGLGSALSAVSQLSGVSSLAGLNLSASDTGKAEAVATLQSETLTERYISDHNLLPVLFSDSWDRERQRWKTLNPKKIPTLWKGNEYFKKRVRSVEQNGKTGLITLTITWKDPKLAAQWANDLVKLTNEYMRDKAIKDSERNIAYLNEQAAKSSVVELRNAIYGLMETEIKKQMVARGSEEYALKVLDPATAPERRSFPQTFLWVGAGFILGVVLGIVALVIRHSLRRGDS